MAETTDIGRVLAVATVREPSERSVLLAAIRELGRDGVDFTVERLEALIRVEDHFHALLLYGQLDFLRQPFGATDTDRDFALTVQRVCLESANGFQRFLRNRSSWAHTPEAIRLMHQVTGLAMHAIHCSVKWGYFLDESSRGAPWKQMHALYSLAEGDGFADLRFILHASQPQFEASVQSLYLRALLLGLLNTGSLTRAQIEIADGWLAQWALDYSLTREEPAGEPIVCLDLASDAGLRLAERCASTEGARYLKAEAMRAQIAHTQAELRHGRLLPTVGAGGAFAIEEHVALLATVEKLHESIMAGGEARVDRRTALESREVDVAIGFERAMRKAREAPAPEEASHPAGQMEMIDVSEQGLSVLAADPSIMQAAAAAIRADPDVERWRVHDLSSRGFGLLVDRAASETVALNALISLRNQETGRWIVGSVVRKQPGRGRGEVLVGIEVIAYRSIAVDLERSQGGSVPGLFLPGNDAGGRRDSVLLALADYRGGSAFTIRMGTASYAVVLNRIVHRGTDWVNARFEIAAKV